MNELNVQVAIENLRREIQTDRLSTQAALDAGFDRIIDKMEEHNEDDAQRFEAVAQRLTGLETKNKILFGGLGTLATAVVGWFFGK